MMTSYLLLLILLTMAVEAQSSGERVFLKMNRVSRGGCPYTASFLCTAKHYVNHMKYGLKWQKMEAANWNAISSHKFKYQLHNISAYFVNHMSAYEHSTRKKYGYERSEKKTLAFSTDAVQHECNNIEQIYSYENNTIALVPFYGGRPPNVTADLKVKSIGQGNSLIKGEIKALQTLAVVCSILRNFATVVVGVTRAEDEKYLNDTLSRLDSSTRLRRVKVLPVETFKPANLPFALLEWGRKYIKGVNECVRLHYPLNFRTDDIPPTAVAKSNANLKSGYYTNATKSYPCNSLFPAFAEHRLRYVYYTESDQILHFSDPLTRRAIMSANNATTFLIGRRMEKQVVKKKDLSTTELPMYMSDLLHTRALCGDPKDVFYLDWPNSTYIQKL